MTISSAVDASAVARAVGIKTQFENRRGGAFTALPQSVALIGQGSSAVSYSTDKEQYTTAGAVAQTYGFGSPLHLAALKLLPINGDGLGVIPMVVYPLEDDVSGVASAGQIVPAGTQTVGAVYQVLAGNVASKPFVIAAGDAVADMTAAMTTAINSELNMPVIATDNTTNVGLVAKWAGVTGNDIGLQLLGSATAGVTFTITPMAGGLVNPDIQDALDQIGEAWETMIVNCLGLADTAALDAVSNFGEGRWDPLVRRPLVSFVGSPEADANTLIAIGDTRKTDRTNSVVPVPGSNDMHFVIAARAVARIAARANSNAPHDYGRLPLDGISVGTDAQQWNYADRNAAVLGGISTSEIRDGVATLGDVVTFYHPDGDPVPPYRYVVDIVRLQNVIYNFDLEFESARWDGAPLIPDDQPTANPDAKKPKMAVAAAASIIDGLALEAILSDPETSKAGIIAEIDGSNPKRLNMLVPITLSGNTNIISIDVNWGFFFGSATIVA